MRSAGRIGLIFSLMAAAFSIGNGPIMITPSPDAGFGSFSVGGSKSFAPGSPMYFPRKHTVETYRSQQRAAKRRRN